MLARLARLARLPRPARRLTLGLVVLLGLGAAVSALGGLGSPGGDTVSRSLSGSSRGVEDLLQPASPPSATGEQSAYNEAAKRTGAGLGAPAPAADPSPASAQGPASAPGSLGGQTLPAASGPAGPARVVKSAVLTIDVGKGGVEGAGKKVLEWVGQAGGFVQSSESAADQATLVIKVPSARLEETVARLKGLGKVSSETLSGADVSQEYVDLDARLRHWRAQEAVFLGLMARAKTISETVQIQQQLSVIQEQIEQLEGRRRYLDDQTSFSTVRLSLLEAGAVAKDPDHPTTTLARAWERATGAALSVVGGSLVALGVLLPLALLLGIPALAVVGLRRRRPSPTAPIAPAT